MELGERISKTKALEWIAGIFEEPVEKVRENTPKDDIEAWDSLGILSLMAALDENFNIQLTETELPSLASVKDILDILEKNGCLIKE